MPWASKRYKERRKNKKQIWEIDPEKQKMKAGTVENFIGYPAFRSWKDTKYINQSTKDIELVMEQDSFMH